MLQRVDAKSLVTNSVLKRLQKHNVDEDKLQMAAGREFQAVGPQTAKLHDP